jgi:hypothetical protein
MEYTDICSAIKEFEDNEYIEIATPNNGSKIPMEAMAMYVMRKPASVPAPRHLARLRRKGSGYDRWRLYQEYCKYSTITDLIQYVCGGFVSIFSNCCSTYQDFNEKHPDEE